jgi:hypothetical protein
MLTLARALNSVADTDSLAVPEFLLVSLTNTLIGKILKVRHGEVNISGSFPRQKQIGENLLPDMNSSASTPSTVAYKWGSNCGL